MIRKGRRIGFGMETEPWKQARSLWENHICHLDQADPDFFLSDEAMLLGSSSVWKHRNYRGLGASFDNCLSLRIIHYVYFRSKKIEGISDKDGFQRMTLTVSQFMRLCVARSACSKDDVWMQKILFDQIVNLRLVRCFVEYILACLQPRTAMRKLKHLLMIQEICYSFTDCVREHRNGHDSSFYLRQALKDLKASSVRAHSLSEPHTLNGMELNACQTVAQLVLTKIMEWYGLKTANGCSLSTHEQNRLVREWFSRFVPFLILCCGGQKPQVLAGVEIPHLAEFEKRLRQGHTDGFLQLPTRCGRTKALVPPTVVFPSSSFPFLRFHVRHINPIIYSLSRYQHTIASGPLLVSAKDGGFLKSSSIAHALHSLVSRVFPRFNYVSSTSIIRSSLLLFVQAYREGKIFRDLTESEFFEALARKYNTTVRQIRVWIGHSNCEEDVATAKELSNVLYTFLGHSVRNKKRSVCDASSSDRRATKRLRLLAGGRAVKHRYGRHEEHKLTSRK